jgi:L-lactate dehydrogenase complex protein LldG
MASKEAFLATVRVALAKGNDGAEVTHADASLNLADDQDIAQKAKALRESLAQRRDSLLEQLHRSALLQEWKIVFVSSDAEAREAIVDIATGLAANTVVRTSHLAVERLGLDEALESKSIHSVLLNSHNADMQGTSAGADIGITGMDYLIAETASASLVAREGAARITSLLPPVHIAVAQADQMVETMEDLLIFREAELAEESDLNWYMNLISGPSKTADIEQTIVIGVHGPGEVHLVVIR